MKHLAITCLFLVGCSSGWALTVGEAFEAGNQAYARGENTLSEARGQDAAMKATLQEAAQEEFGRALAHYKACLEQAESSSLHFNLGNTYFNLGQLGRSIYHFRRAQELDPASEEARANLIFVRSVAGLEAPTDSLYGKTLARRSPGFWAWLSAVGFWAGAALLVFPRMYGSRGPGLPIFGVVVLLFSLVPEWALLQAGNAKSLAIVLDNDTPLLVSPAGDSAATTYLQGGEAVELNLSREHTAHVFVTTTRGEEGWVARAELGRVRE